MIKLFSLGNLENCGAGTERSQEEGGENFFGELMSLLDIMKLKCQQDIKVVLRSRQVKTWGGVA